MTMTGMMANALRKNTTCPSGTVSPTYRTNADITASSNTETSLLEMARRKFMEQCCLGRGAGNWRYRALRERPTPYWHGAWHYGRQAAIADPQRCRDVNAGPCRNKRRLRPPETAPLQATARSGHI